jgi:predicted RNA-binding protein YlxR (DUF448 family)
VSSARRSPQRSCVGCGARDAQAAMRRLRIADDGGIDAGGARKTGRSAYVHERRECIDGLARSRGLGRSLRAQVDREARTALAKRLAAELAATTTDA